MKRGSTLPSALSPTLPHTTAKNDENTRLGVLQRAIEAADLEAHIKRGALAQAAAHASEFTSCGSDGVVKLLPGAIEAITKAASDQSIKYALDSRKRGDTALHVACYVGDDRTNIVEALLNGPQGAAVLNSHATLDGATALMRCCESNAVECVKVLVQRGADVNDTDHSGATALHWALSLNRYEIASYLLGVRAKKCARCTKCPLWLKMMARRQTLASGSTSIAPEAVSLLLPSHGSDRGCVCGSGKTRRCVCGAAPTAPSRPPQEDTAVVLEEEFGSISLEGEIERLKAEDASGAGHRGSIASPPVATGTGLVGLEQFGIGVIGEEDASTDVPSSKAKGRRRRGGRK